MFNPRDLVRTIPFVLVGLGRFYALTGRAEEVEARQISCSKTSPS